MLVCHQSIGDMQLAQPVGVVIQEEVRHRNNIHRNYHVTGYGHMQLLDFCTCMVSFEGYQDIPVG